mmetsp:Transcript_34230/g.81182  ORF Transcript_34230/g.81182 Transcript_34230/m.81182 type:complete len:332 (+) Transcript_34230:217-1212(+)
MQGKGSGREGVKRLCGETKHPVRASSFSGAAKGRHKVLLAGDVGQFHALVDGHRDALLADRAEERGAEVPLAKRRDDDHDQLPLKLGTAADPLGRLDGGARGDAAEEALLLRQPPRHRDRVVARDLHDLVVDVRVEDAGDKAGADALDLVRAGRAAREDSALRGLDGDDPHAALDALEVLPGAGDGAACADARDERVDGAGRVAKDLGAGGGPVDRRVGGVLKLLQHVGAVRRRRDFLRLLHRTAHPLGRVREDELRAKGLQEHAALERHGGRHRQDELVALRSSDEREANSGVSACRLDKSCDSGSDPPSLLCFLNHVFPDTILHTAARF